MLRGSWNILFPAKTSLWPRFTFAVPCSIAEIHDAGAPIRPDTLISCRRSDQPSMTSADVLETFGLTTFWWVFQPYNCMFVLPAKDRPLSTIRGIHEDGL